MKTLVAYFSASGVTANVAKLLAEAAGADLFEIQPAVPYTNADLNWMDKKSRSTVEMQDKSSRPAIAAPCSNFSGKKIVLFATSGGSGFGKTVANLKDSAPGATIVEGKLLNGTQSVAGLKSWVDSILK